MSDAGPEIVDQDALQVRRERVFLVLAGIFLGSMTMLNILGARPAPSDSTQIRPPWTSTIRRTTASPTPVPCQVDDLNGPRSESRRPVPRGLVLRVENGHSQL